MIIIIILLRLYPIFLLFSVSIESNNLCEIKYFLVKIFPVQVQSFLMMLLYLVKLFSLNKFIFIYIYQFLLHLDLFPYKILYHDLYHILMCYLSIHMILVVVLKIRIQNYEYLYPLRQIFYQAWTESRIYSNSYYNIL